ncbi:MAG: hypothetical protein AUJ57_00400 [Zetaproteobacteria bacterium CG1_02_53_45]|nr:MAG: hypothetical protein AUJ57_00400 [Zetaproteobacteria bacterium CG1_02_53_45]
MDVDLIRTFIQVAKTSHFRKAAEQLYLTQSAVSARIKQLEERLGVKLFERSKHQVSLTTAGVRFLAHAEQLLAAWNRACQEVRLPEQADSTMITGATDTIWNMFLIDWIIEVNRILPQVMIRAELYTGDALMTSLLDGSLDIAVMFDAPALPRLQIEELAAVPFIMVASRDSLVAADAIQAGFIEVDWGESFAAAFQQHFGSMYPVRINTSIGKVALELILKSGGVAYLPKPMILPFLQQKKLFPVLDAPVIVRPVYAAQLAGHPQNSNVSRAIEMMRASLTGRLTD